MEKIHPMSVPATKSELDLFLVPTTQMVITGNQTQWHLPISDFTNNQKRIEFFIPPMQEYTDLSNIFLYVKFNVQKEKTENNVTTIVNMEAGDNCVPAQYFLNTMFSNIELTLGNKKITTPGSYFYYKAYFDGLFFATDEAKNTILKTAMWDTSTKRGELVKLSKDVELYGRIHLDICQQDKLLLPAVPLRIQFNLNPEKINFLVEASAGDATAPKLVPRLNLKEMKLSVRKYEVDDSCKLGIESALQTADAKYFITRTDISTRHIPTGVERYVFDLLKSTLPRLFIIGFIPNNNLSGNLIMDNYKFGDSKVKYISAHKGGKVLNGTAYTPDYVKDNYAREYTDLYRALCQDHSEPIMSISQAQFKNSCCFYAFNLTPDFVSTGADNGSTNLLEYNTVSIEVAFTETTTTPLNVICYSLYDNHVAIDMNREVKIDY